MTKKDIKTIQRGQWVRVFYDDIGVEDGIAIDSGKDAIEDGRYISVLHPFPLDSVSIVSFDQVVAISGVVAKPPRY